MDITFGFGFAGLCLAVAWYSVKKLEHSDPIDRLERLRDLHQAGAIDDEEYEALRKRQIKRMKSYD